MNKRTVLASLNKIANELDNNGLHNEADTVTKVMSRLAMEFNENSNPNLTNGLDEISSMMDMHGNHPADKLREDYSRDYNNPSRSEMGNVFRDLDELVQESMTMNSKQRERYEEIKKQIIDGYGEDYDMGPESQPFDYSSPEDKGDMYGDDMSGYMDKDTDF
jgi:hypothetical protein